MTLEQNIRAARQEKGLHYSPGLAAQLTLTLGQTLTRLGGEFFQRQREEISRTLQELDRLSREHI